MRLPVPVNIVTGALGAGKTTAISRLLASKPVGETWAVLVNEFGSLGIDGAVLEGVSGSGIVVRELAGGCLCCTMSGPLGASVAQLVRRTKPDRLIIEPSGLGHPAGLLDTLQNEHLRSSLDIKAIICLVDVRQVGTTAFESNETYQDQVNVCDVLVGTKSDLLPQPASQADRLDHDLAASLDESLQLSTSDKNDDSGKGADSGVGVSAATLAADESGDPLSRFRHWTSELYPPKAKVIIASHGQLPSDLLNLSRDSTYEPFFKSAHRGGNRKTAGPQPWVQLPDSMNPGPGTEQEGEAGACPIVLGSLEPGKPMRFLSAGSPQHLACGWIISRDSVFDRQRLSKLLQALFPLTIRLKGVFRVGPKSWVVPRMPEGETSGGGVKLDPISYRRESRVEMIVTRPDARGRAAHAANAGLEGRGVEYGLAAPSGGSDGGGDPSALQAVDGCHGRASAVGDSLNRGASTAQIENTAAAVESTDGTVSHADSSASSHSEGDLAASAVGSAVVLKGDSVFSSFECMLGRLPHALASSEWDEVEACINLATLSN